MNKPKELSMNKMKVMVIAVLVLVVGLLPVVIALKIAKLFTDNFTKCPYCGKVFLSKKAKFGIISKLKFW